MTKLFICHPIQDIHQSKISNVVEAFHIISDLEGFNQTD